MVDQIRKNFPYKPIKIKSLGQRTNFNIGVFIKIGLGGFELLKGKVIKYILYNPEINCTDYGVKGIMRLHCLVFYMMPAMNANRKTV